MAKEGLRRADYTLYDWQIRAIRKLAQGRKARPSQVVQELLTQALQAQQASSLEQHEA